MQFKIIEDVGQDIKTVENNSSLQLEFHIYSPDRSNPQSDQFIAQLEQRISAFGAENAEEKNESGKTYSMFRLTGKKFQSTQQIPEFFQKEFLDFIKIIGQVWAMSSNFIRVLIIDDSKPPKRIPGKIYTLLSNSDYQDMLLELKGG